MSSLSNQSKPFELIPAIDLLGGQAVRLSQGDYDQATVYDSDPANVAKGFFAKGVKRLHVVDLDGAKAGRPMAGRQPRGHLSPISSVLSRLF